MRTHDTPVFSEKEDGFTLVEALIALVVLLVGTTGLAMAQLYALRTGGETAARSRALYLAEEQLDTFMAIPRDDPLLLVPGPGPAGGAQAFDPHPDDEDLTPYYRCWNVSPPDPAGLIQVVVEVRAGDPPNPGDPVCDATAAATPRGAARLTGYR